jgi:hypothetical protein
MLFLQTHHITDLYCFVDDLLPLHTGEEIGRPAMLTSSEIITILLWNVLVVQQHTLKGIYKWTKIYHRKEFPRFPGYAGFVATCHRSLPLLRGISQELLSSQSPLRFTDSTMLEVCKLL